MKDDIWMESIGTASGQVISKLTNLVRLEEKDPMKLTKEQAWLLTPDIICFALDIKSWCKCLTNYWRLWD